MELIGWTVAKKQGLNRYFTGVPCKCGHVCVRDVSDRSCYECKLIKAALWKHKNAEKHAVANALWAIRRADSVKNTVKRSRAKDPKKYWVRATWQSAKARAAKKGVPFNLTKEDVYALAGTVCPVFGTPFDFIGNGRICPASPSMDRIRPELGYVLGNIAIISMKANSIKQNATAAQIRAVADWLEQQK